MRRINDISYDVRRNERITIDVEPTDFLDTAPFVEAVLDKTPLSNIGTKNAPRFSFTVTKPLNATHRVTLEFTFLPITPAQACYQVTIAGQNDVGCPCGFDICKTDETRNVIVAFDVMS